MHAAKAAPSSLHSKVLPASVAVKLKPALVALVSAGGLAVIVVSGAVVSATPVPETLTALFPPFEVTARLTEKTPGVFGAKRTTIVWLEPAGKLNAPPDTIMNGAGTDAPPVSVPLPVFCTVKDRSIDPPTTTLPKSTGPAGETVRVMLVATVNVPVTPPTLSVTVADSPGCAETTRTAT